MYPPPQLVLLPLLSSPILPHYQALPEKTLEQFSYDLEMKTCKQNRNNKLTDIECFDWFIERIQTHVAFGWLSEH